MWAKIKLPLIILSVSLNVAFIAFWAMCAGPRMLGHHRQAGGCPMDACSWCPFHKLIGVDEKQWQNLEPAMVEFQRKAQALRKEVQGRRAELIDLLAASEVQEKAVEAKREEVIAAQRKMQALVTDHLMEQKKSLTPEQQKKLFDMLRAQSGCMGPGSGPRGGCGQ